MIFLAQTFVAYPAFQFPKLSPPFHRGIEGKQYRNSDRHEEKKNPDYICAHNHGSFFQGLFIQGFGLKGVIGNSNLTTV
jgi:hypothetical protein